MEVIVHYPTKEADWREIQKRIAKIHAQFVLQYVESLNCPLEQKRQLIDAVVNTIREREEQNKDKNQPQKFFRGWFSFYIDQS